MDNSTNFLILLLIVGIFIMLASQMDLFDDDDDDDVTVIYGYDRPWYPGRGYWGRGGKSYRRRWGRRRP